MITIWGPGAIEYRFQHYRELESLVDREKLVDLVAQPAAAPPVDFVDRGAGLRFLNRFIGNPISIAKLRGLLYRHNLGTDLRHPTVEESLMELATLMYWGRVVVTEHLRAQPGILDVDTQAPPAPEYSASAAPAPSTSAPEDDSPTLPDNDGATQAAALRAAAKAGVPFCEECAKAAAAAALKN